VLKTDKAFCSVNEPVNPIPFEIFLNLTGSKTECPKNKIKNHLKNDLSNKTSVNERW